MYNYFWKLFPVHRAKEKQFLKADQISCYTAIKNDNSKEYGILSK